MRERRNDDERNSSKKFLSDPNFDLRLLQVPASAVATALKDMMRKLEEPLLCLDLFDECQNLTGKIESGIFTNDGWEISSSFS